MAFDYDDFCRRLRVVAIIRNEEDFSGLFGKNPSYVSANKSKCVEPSLDALTNFLFNIEEQLKESNEELKSDYGTEQTLHRCKTLYEIHSQTLLILREKVREQKRQLGIA